MNKNLLNLGIFIIIVISVILLYIFPFTKYQIYQTVESYFDYIEEKKVESLELITTAEQYRNDIQFIDKVIVKTYKDHYKFMNRTTKILENDTTSATVEVSGVIQINVNGKVKTQPTLYHLELVRAKNSIGDKTWIVTHGEIIQ